MQRSTHIGVEEWFRLNATSHPDAEAVVESDRAVSYGELDRLASRVASQLCKYDVCIEEPIGILLPKGIASIVAQIAIIRIGASCVPLDLAFPNQRIQKLYNNLKVRIVLTNSIEQYRAPSHCSIVLVEDEHLANSSQDMKSGESCIIRTGSAHRTHVLHTSGTTGEPKGVEILSQGIMCLANNTSVIRFRKTDRIAQIAAPSFDVTLLEIWTTLVVGGTIVVISNDILLDPYAFYEALQKHRVTAVIMTPTLLQHIVSVIPNAFAGLNWVVTGGEPANPKVYKAIFDNGPPKILANGYGPTECTVVASYHSTKPADCLNASIPIGKPIDGVTLSILDNDLTPVGDGVVGEICVEGGTISRGYHNRPDANTKRFCQRTLASGQAQHFFRTGDLGRYTDAGEIEFLGRNDELVKINSKRIDLTEIKTVIMDSGFLVDAVVIPVSRPAMETYIVAFIVPRAQSALDLKLDAHMKQFLPEYMVPRIEIIASVPMTPHGKADRRLLLNTHVAACEKIATTLRTSKSDTESPLMWLRQLWISTLGISKVDDRSNFFDCGGTSLQAATLLMHIRRRFNLQITMRQIYDLPELQQMANLIELAMYNGEFRTKQIDASILDTLTADSKLVNKIDIQSSKVSDRQAKVFGHVFMTGATGYLGIHILRDMLRRMDVDEVRCLVRATDPQKGRLRLVSLLREVGIHDDIQLRKVVAIPGTLGDEDLGLKASTFSDLADWADTVFHIGAHINYSQPYESHRAPNVIGTLDCIRLAVTTRLKSLHYVSTAAVSGPAASFSGQERIMEDVDLDDFRSSLPYDIGYTQSKWVADKMVLAMQRRGLPAVIYRPGFIMGDGVNCKVSHDDFMARLFRGCLQLGYRPILPRQSKVMVTVNFASAAITHIASNPANCGHAFHIAPQNREEDPELEALWAILDRLGYKCSAISYREWIEVMATDTNMLSNPLFSLLHTLQEPVRDGRSLWELYNDMGFYDVTKCRAALADMKYEHKSGIDQDFLVNYMREITRGDKR